MPTGPIHERVALIDESRPLHGAPCAELDAAVEVALDKAGQLHFALSASAGSPREVFLLGGEARLVLEGFTQLRIRNMKRYLGGEIGMTELEAREAAITALAPQDRGPGVRGCLTALAIRRARVIIGTVDGASVIGTVAQVDTDTAGVVHVVDLEGQAVHIALPHVVAVTETVQADGS